MKPNSASAAAVVVRVALGADFIAHGGQKVLGGLSGFAASLADKGLPFADATALLVVLTEIGGGLFLIAGLLTRLAAAALIIDMVGAIATTTIANGFFAQEGGFEFNLVIVLGLLVLLIAGPGRPAIDAVLLPRFTAARRTRAQSA